MAAELANVRQLVRKQRNGACGLARDRARSERGKEDVPSEHEGFGAEPIGQEAGEAAGMKADPREQLDVGRKALRQTAIQAGTKSKGTSDQLPLAPSAAQMPLRSGTICLMSTE